MRFGTIGAGSAVSTGTRGILDHTLPERSAPCATVQRILRHSSISVTTGTYLDVIEEVQRAAVAGMDSLLSPTQ
jgi:hypothetical protein